ncbi:MAG: ABC transporter substrate-binding protein [Candidatus Wallbacteria bacterium]
MKNLVKNIFPALLLIFLAGTVLLLSDNDPGRNHKNQIRKIAIVQQVSREILNLSVKGFIDGLNERGYAEGKNVSFTKYNPENDMPTANAIAKEVVNDGYFMIMTASTTSLQSVAAANLEGKVIHVFGTVTDPFTAGVGFDAKDHSKRPKHIAGIGTFQPVEAAFRLAKKINPNLKTVGTPWCTSESCAVSCLAKARKICAELGITLIEKNVTNTNDILEVTKALTESGIEAIWVGGDNVVESGIELVIKAATDKNIPVFTNNPEHASKGAIFGIGANYYEVGQAVAKIAADILDGKKPETIPVDDVTPQKIYFNNINLDKFGAMWDLSEQNLKGSDGIYEKSGLRNLK